MGRIIYAYLSYGSQIKDLSGNPLSGNYFEFTTGFTANSTPPAITGNSPKNGDTGLPVNAQVMISFSEPIDEITATQGVTVSLNGAPVAGSITFQNYGQLLVFTQAAPLLPGVYTVTTTPGLTDVSGNPDL